MTQNSNAAERLFFPAAPHPGELPQAVAHSVSHPMTVPCICAFSALGYITVSLVLLLIKNFGATSTEIVKSMRKVCQVRV